MPALVDLGLGLLLIGAAAIVVVCAIKIVQAAGDKKDK